MSWEKTRIPQFVRKRGQAEVGEIAEAVGLSHARTLKMCIQLVDEGELIDLGGVLKSAPSEYDNAGAPPTQTRLWKVFHALDAKELFTARDAARLAECNVKYTQAYLKWLSDQGFVGCRKIKGRPHHYYLNAEAPPAGRPPRWRDTRNRKAKKEARRAAR